MSSRSEFSKFLKSMNEDELRNELKSLYSSMKEVKMHYIMELGDDAERKKIFDRAKQDIYNLYYIRNIARKRPRVAKIKAKLKEMNKISVFTHEMVDLYLHTTEVCQQYLDARYSTTTATYNSCYDAFDKALDLIDKSALHDDFKERCHKIAVKARKQQMDDLMELYMASFIDPN